MVRQVASAAESSKKVRVLVTDSLHPAGWELLKSEGAMVDQLPDGRRDDLFAYAARVDALVIRTATKVTRELLAAAPSVKVVGRAGAGVDNVDVAAAGERGVVVVNAPEANAVSAAEHAFGLMLSVARGIARVDRELKQQRWPRAVPLGVELAGRTLGIVGFGRVGQRVAVRARAFEMAVLVNDPVIDTGAVASIGVEVVPDIERLLGRSDCLTVHVPLDAETRGLIGARELSLLPPGALVINCARGGIIDEQALLVALDSRAVGGAGIDVFETEPLTDFDLAGHPCVVATPHLGASTEAAKERVGIEIARNVLDALRKASSVDLG